jgi:acetyl-CoA carboxylase biotin carboxyl carrier protein
VTLTAKEVAEITRLLEESSFDELYLELDGLKLSLKRSGAASSSQPLPAAPASPPSPEVIAARQARDGAAAAAADPQAEDVTAPLLGTFYRAPKPGAPPFVEVGSPVQQDTVIGIIEVMKLMNAVRAGIQGTVAEIVAGDGELVEYGETLVRVRTAS